VTPAAAGIEGLGWPSATPRRKEEKVKGRIYDLKGEEEDEDAGEVDGVGDGGEGRS